MCRHLVIALLLLSFSPGELLSQEGANNPPAQAQQPPASDNQAPQPDQQKKDSPTSQSEQAPAPKEPEQAPAPNNEDQPASKNTEDKAKSSGKSSPQKDAAQSPGDPHKVVIRKGSIGEPKAQLAPGMSEEQAKHNRQNANQLLASTESNLQKLSGRTLSASQQDTVGQIRNYMGLARTALDKGDPQRARNLAFKAHLLSDDLVKHQ